MAISCALGVSVSTTAQPLVAPQVRKVEKIYKELLLNSVEQAKIRLSIVATQADAVSLSKSDKR